MDQKVKLKNIKSDEWYGNKPGLEFEVSQDKKNPDKWFVTDGVHAGKTIDKKFCRVPILVDLDELLEEYEHQIEEFKVVPRINRSGSVQELIMPTKTYTLNRWSEADVNALGQVAKEGYVAGLELSKNVLKTIIKIKEEEK